MKALCLFCIFRWSYLYHSKLFFADFKTALFIKFHIGGTAYKYFSVCSNVLAKHDFNNISACSSALIPWIYKQIRKDIGEIFRKLCNEMKVEIIEAEACVDHIHMLVSIPPYMSVAQLVGTLKSKSTLMIFERHANLKYKYGNRHFWCRGYYVDTVGKNERIIQDYIRNQLEEDNMHEQISMKEYIDPFTGSKNK